MREGIESVRIAPRPFPRPVCQVSKRQVVRLGILHCLHHPLEQNSVGQGVNHLGERKGAADSQEQGREREMSVGPEQKFVTKHKKEKTEKKILVVHGSE